MKVEVKMTSADTSARLQNLLDRQDIHDALMRYCRGVDRCDEALMQSAYHEDAVAFAINAWDFVEHFIPDNKAATTFTMHSIANLDIDVVGDKAYSEAYFVTYVGREEDGQEFVDAFCGRYVDRWERRNDDWKIIHREVAREWSRANAFGLETFPVPPREKDTFQTPRRDRSDISFQL
jgi:ketosteroid isomerase-like protein